MCAGELSPGEWLTQDSNPDWIPSPHSRGGAEAGLGVFCGPAARPEVVGDRTASLTPPRGSLDLGVWALIGPHAPVQILDSCVALGPACCLWACFPSPIQTGFHAPQAQTPCNGLGRATRG